MDNIDLQYHNIISLNIKKFRKSAKISQEAMAEKLCCSREFISRVENQKERVSLNMLLKMANLFNTSPSNFFKQP